MCIRDSRGEPAPRQAPGSPLHRLDLRVDHPGDLGGDRPATAPRLPAALDVLLGRRAPSSRAQRRVRAGLPDRGSNRAGGGHRRGGGEVPEGARGPAGGSEMNALWPLLLILGSTPPAPAPAPDEGKLPAPLEALFQEKDKDGKPILGDSERAYLKKLPPHTRELIGKDVDALTVGGASHLKALLALELPSQGAAIVFSDNCILCHTDPESQKKICLLYTSDA